MASHRPRSLVPRCIANPVTAAVLHSSSPPSSSSGSAACTATVSSSRWPSFVMTRPPFSSCSTKPISSSCCRQYRAILPEPLEKVFVQVPQLPVLGGLHVIGPLGNLEPSLALQVLSEGHDEPLGLHILHSGHLLSTTED